MRQASTPGRIKEDADRIRKGDTAKDLETAGLDFHFHVLIGGLSGWHADERLEFMRRWNKLSGDARIAIYDPDLLGVRYILKYVEPNDMDSIEFHLASRTRLQSEFGAK